MDQVRIGKYIAFLRHQKKLTQEELAVRLHVTNKTVSRWERGNYMPDIEMLKLLSEEFGVSVDDILTADIPEETVSDNSLSFNERKAYFIKKWPKDHLLFLIIIAIIIAASLIIPFIIQKPWYIGFTPVISLVLYCYQNNRMMIYIEDNLYH